MRAATIAASAAVLMTAAGCGDDEAPEAETQEAELTTQPGWAEAYPDARGSATVSEVDGTTFELALSGLAQFTEFTAHVHDGTCDERPSGGGHWLADPDGEDVESNWIHVTVETGVEGNATGSAEFDFAPDDRATSVVVHVVEADTDEAERMPSDRVLCGDLETG